MVVCGVSLLLTGSFLRTEAGDAETKLAEIVLQHGAGYNERLSQLFETGTLSETEKHERTRLWVEYFIHRVTVVSGMNTDICMQLRMS